MNIRVRTKICGITRTADAVAACQAGADAIGLVFYSKSSRYLSDIALARQIALSVGPFVSVVGLFVNPEPSEVKNVLEHVPLGVLQFHGDEPQEFCLQFERPFLKALRMRPELDVTEAVSKYSRASGVLLDAYRPGIPGGTGEVFDWQRVPRSSTKPIILAGGLSPKNVAEAIKTAGPWGVDVSGGVESAPGIKDRSKIQEFIQNTKV